MFDKSFQRLILDEGDYADHPHDPGGQTMYGITVAVARANGYTGDMMRLDLDTARRIYKSQYWDINSLDDIAALSPAIAHEVFDTGVNMGTGTAGRYLQTALNALNRQQADYPDLTVDGNVGPQTVHALNRYLAARRRLGEVVLLRALDAQQGASYLAQAQANPKKESFIFGWFANRVRL